MRTKYQVRSQFNDEPSTVMFESTRKAETERYFRGIMKLFKEDWNVEEKGTGVFVVEYEYSTSAYWITIA